MQAGGVAVGPTTSFDLTAIREDPEVPRHVALRPRRAWPAMMPRMRIIGLAGWSGSGKTTLLTKVIPRLVARGLKVSTLKHAHHDFDIDQPGKDSHTHRLAGATEVLVGSANRWALVHELRERARSRRWPRCSQKLSPVDLVIVEGFKRASASQARSVPRGVGKPLLHPDDPAIVAIASDAPLPAARCRWSISTISRASPICSIRDAAPIDAIRCAMRGALMAQLTDDCFAFSGPLLPVDEVERLIASASRRWRRPRPLRSMARAAACSPATWSRRIDLPPFDNSAVDGYAVRHADLDAEEETRLAIVDRVTAGQRAARALRRGEAIRIFTGAPMPAGADTVFMQEDVRAEGGTVIVPPGLEARRQPAARRRGRARGSGRAAGGPPACAPQHVALAAALGLTDLRCAGACASRCSRPATRSSSRARARPAAALFDANRYLLAGLHRSASAPRSPISASCPTIRERLARAIAAGRAGARSGADLGRRLDRRGRPRAQRGRDRRPPGVLARRDQAGPAGGDGRDPGIKRRERGLRRPARQSGRGRSSRSRAWCGRCCCGSPAPLPEPLIACRCARRSPTARRRAGANTCA